MRRSPILCDTVCAELDEVLGHRPVPREYVPAPGNGGTRVRVAFNQNKSQYSELLPVAGFHISDDRTLRLGNLTLESISMRTQGLDYDLAGTVYESEKSIVVGWNYNAAMFRPATMARFSAQFERTLRGVASQDSTVLSTIDLDGP